MNANELKIFFDNRDSIFVKVDDVSNSLTDDEIEQFNGAIAEGDIDKAYTFFQKSGISLSEFKLILLSQDSKLRDNLFSYDEYANILKNCIELYGDTSMVLNPNSRNFNIKDLEPLLSLNDSKCSEYYKSVVDQKLSSAKLLGQYADILKDVNSSFINEEAIIDYINNYSSTILDSGSIELLNILPSSVLKDGVIFDSLLNKIDNIRDTKIIDYIPHDENYSKLIGKVLDKYGSDDLTSFFERIPQELMTKEIYEKFCEKKISFISKIPKSDVPQEDYNKWFNEVALHSISNSNKDSDILSIVNECIDRKTLDEETWYSILKTCSDHNFDRHKLAPYLGSIESLIPQDTSIQMLNDDERQLYGLLTDKEKDLYKKFRVNNIDLYKTLKIEMFNPSIVNVIGEKSLERLVRYDNVQDIILYMSNSDNALKTFEFALSNLGQDKAFVEPLIEKIALNVTAQMSREKDGNGYAYKSSQFLDLVAQRIDKKDIPFTDYEKAIIPYLTLHPNEAKNITSYNDILQFVDKKNNELESIVNNESSSFNDIANAYFQRLIGMNYEEVNELVNIYGNDPEELLKNYINIDSKSFKELSEKEALEIIIKLKNVCEIKDINTIRNEFNKLISEEKGENPFIRYQMSEVIEESLKRAYGRDMVNALSTNVGKCQTEEREYNGEKYIVRNVSGEFDRMISVLGGFSKSEAVDDDMYDRWNTNKMARKHALCFSLINQSNPACAIGKNKGLEGIADKDDTIIISINGFSPEAINAAAPEDMGSENFRNTVGFSDGSGISHAKYYTAKNMPNKTRGNEYSEYSIEILDVLAGDGVYRKIQPASIICFEEVNEKSIKASIELSKKLGYTVPIEVIDRRKLAKVEMEHIKESFEKFVNEEDIDTDLVADITTRFCNVHNAHMADVKTELQKEIIGKDAPFNLENLTNILNACILSVKKKTNDGKLEEGLMALESIKSIITSEKKEIGTSSDTMKSLISNIEKTITEMKTPKINSDEAVHTDEIEKQEMLQQMINEGKQENLGYDTGRTI